MVRILWSWFTVRVRGLGLGWVLSNVKNFAQPTHK